MLEMLKVTQLMLIRQDAPHCEEPMQLHYYSNTDNGCALKSISFFYTELSETEMEETFVSTAKLEDTLKILHH